METKSEVGINSGCANFSTTNWCKELPENGLAIAPATKEYTSVEDRVIETNSNLVRGFIHILPLTLTHIGIQNLTQQVANKVDDVHKDVKNIKQILAETRRSATLPSSDTVVQQIPLKPGVFHGRDDIIEEITELLMKEETSRVCILGPGGMGKTSVSLGVVEHPLIKSRFLPENIVWVPCIEATSATLLLEILYIQLQVPGSKQVTIEKIISVLNTSTQPRLILLDNFETPYNVPGGAQKQVEDILRQLAMLSHVAILVTMRGRYPPCDEAIKWQSKDIRPTDEAACLRIYYNICPDSKNDRDVGRLLCVLGHMPFAVTLMARLAKEGMSTAEELLVAWSEYGPDILPDHEQSMNRSISLSVDSYLMKQNPQALLLLKILSCLPAGTTKASLRWWVPALDLATAPSAIATLFKAGLLVENERQDSASPVLFVLPVVQSFMQQHGRIEEEIRLNIQSSCHQYVLDHACRVDDPAFPIKSKALAAEDVNIQAILYGSPIMQHSIMSSDRAVEALIAFSWYRCDTKPNLEITKRAVSVAKASGVKKYIASTLWCLGTTYGLLGEFYVAYDHLLEAYKLFNSLLPGDLELQRLCCRCGIDLVDGARLTFEDGNKAVSLARDVERQSATFSDDLIHTRSMIILGLVLDSFGHRPEALRYLERAKMKAIGSDLLSDVCYSITLVHYHENRLPEALNAVKEAWEHAKSGDSLVHQAQTSLVFGMILFSANRDTEAWKYIEISLMKNTHLGNRRDSASALEYMGYAYLRRGDYVNAYGAYEAAAENYRGTVDEEPDGTTCRNNMAKIKDKQGNRDLKVGFKRPRMDNDSSLLFYPAV